MSTSVTSLTFEHLRDPLGLGIARPRLSWITETTTPNWTQSAYEIEARGEVVLVESPDSVLVEWPFGPLESRERITVGVRVAGPTGAWTDWTRTDVEAALLRTDDWSAAFVSPGDGSLLRREFEVRPGLRSARLYATALGVYEAELNGSVVGDHVLAPGWTSYQQRLRYQTFDVTALLTEGPNCLGATVGDGWYRGRSASRASGPTTATARPSSPSSNSPTRTARSNASSPTAPGPPRPDHSCPATSTTASTTTPAWSGRAGPLRPSTTRAGRRPKPSTTTWPRSSQR